MNRIIYFTLFSFVMLFASCNSAKVTRYTIASETRNCEGVVPQKCLLVKKPNQANWEFFYNNIEGFDYTEGYEYIIDVKEEKRKNVPADASALRYILRKEVSKILKQSENLPQSVVNNYKSYQLTGKVLSVKKLDSQKNADVFVVEIGVTSSVNKDLKEGDVIFAELVVSPRVMPVEGREYVFKAKYKYPTDSRVYLLDTDVMDLIR